MTATTSRPAPRWAVLCAWTVPLTVLPSAAWRASLVLGEDDWLRAIGDGGWCLLLLSVLSVGLGALTIGLVRPWGEVWPRWVPLLAGREVPARPVAIAAWLGASVIMLLPVYVIVYRLFLPFDVRPLIDPDGIVHPAPGLDVLSFYFPMLAWGPLLLAVATDYLRRRSPVR